MIFKELSYHQFRQSDHETVPEEDTVEKEGFFETIFTSIENFFINLFE